MRTKGVNVSEEVGPIGEIDWAHASLPPEIRSRFEIEDLDGPVLVVVKPDGSVEFGERFKGTDAERTAWEIVGAWVGRVLEGRVVTNADLAAEAGSN